MIFCGWKSEASNCRGLEGMNGMSRLIKYLKVLYSKTKFHVYTFAVYSSLAENQSAVHKEMNGYSYSVDT